MTDEIAPTPKRKNLRLTIELPDVYADDLDEHAGYLADAEPSDEDRLWLVTEEWFREDVVVVLTSFPGDKCQNHEFEVVPFTGRIVGASTVDDPNYIGRGQK